MDVHRILVDITTSIVIIIILLAFSAFFGGLEVALVAITDVQIEQFLLEKKKGAKSLKKLKSNPSRMITTIMLGNNIVNVAASTLAAEIAISIFGSIGVGIATGVMTFVILVFGEITPKAYSNIYASKMSLTFAKPIDIMTRILYPLVVFFEGLTNMILKTLNADSKKVALTDKEFEATLRIGVKEKVLEIGEKRFIEGVLKLNDLTVRSIMTPRVKMFTIDSKIGVKEAIATLAKGEYSRVPVIENTKDTVVGIIHLRDILKTVAENKKYSKIKSVSRKPIFVSQEKLIGDLLREFQGRREHMAIVVDEFGGVEGLVTLEDIIEEIFGEIMDEKDILPQFIYRLDKNSCIVHGETDIRLVNDYLGTDLESGEDYSTISGLLHTKLQDMPQQGERVEINNCTLIVENTEGNTPIRVRVNKEPQKEDADDDEEEDTTE